ncbi:MAG: glycerate kinase [Planctomycetota bacterium]
MKVVVAPDSFKESLTAAQVTRALAEGVLEAAGDAQVDLCPMADGGEGTVEAMVAATDGSFRSADVFDPIGRQVRARFGLLGTPSGPGLPGLIGLLGAMDRTEGEGEYVETERGAVAVVEMAAASGLALVPADLRDPMTTTTFGTGELIRAALDVGAREIIIGVGGSGTVDGGCGCAQALGVTFLDDKGQPVVCGLAGGGLAEVERIDLSDRDPRLDEVDIRVACDVTNPLTGPQGAARVYGPQKGATPEQVERLEVNLKHLAEVIRRELGLDVESMAGAGAAGGLGAGLAAFAGATLERGVDLVARTVRLSDRLQGADLCLTGEGCFDASSRHGKATAGVAELARAAGEPVACIAGQIGENAPHELFDIVYPLVGGPVTVEDAWAKTEALLAQRAATAVRRILSRREG